jgi:hypothetical protein
LRSHGGEDSGLDYAIRYRFKNNIISKEIEVRGSEGARLRSVEPVVFGRGCDLLFVENGIEIRSPQGSSFILTAYGHGTRVGKASRDDVIWNSHPGLYVLPIVVEDATRSDPWRIRYRIELCDWE